MAKRSGPTPREQDLLTTIDALRATIAELRAVIAGLEAKVAHLEKRNAELESELAKAKKNSGNSSKPPSSDIVKPPKPSAPHPGGKRNRGGRKGHAKFERLAFSPDEIDIHSPHPLSVCPGCGGPVVEHGRERIPRGLPRG